MFKSIILSMAVFISSSAHANELLNACANAFYGNQNEFACFKYAQDHGLSVSLISMCDNLTSDDSSNFYCLANLGTLNASTAVINACASALNADKLEIDCVKYSHDNRLSENEINQCARVSNSTSSFYRCLALLKPAVTPVAPATLEDPAGNCVQ